MSATPQTQAIQVAAQIMQVSSALLGLVQQVQAIDAAWNDNGVANILNALGTVALNTDGSAGAADGAPNVAHPISPTLFPGLGRLVSSNQIASMKTVIDNLPTWINAGAAVAATGTAGQRAILNSASGG